MVYTCRGFQLPFKTTLTFLSVIWAKFLLQPMSKLCLNSTKLSNEYRINITLFHNSNSINITFLFCKFSLSHLCYLFSIIVEIQTNRNVKFRFRLYEYKEIFAISIQRCFVSFISHGIELFSFSIFFGVQFTTLNLYWLDT